MDGVLPSVPLLGQAAVIIVLAYLAVCLWDYYVQQTRDHGCSLPLPPGDSGLPIVGETLHLVWDFVRGVDFYDKKRMKYGNIYRTHIFGKPTIRITDNDEVRNILMSENTLVTSSYPSSMCRLLGNETIITSSGYRHKHKRKTVLRAFHRRPLERQASHMENLCKAAINNWCRLQDIVVLKEARKLAFQAAWEVLLGERFDDLPEKTVIDIIDDFEQFLCGFWTVPFNIPGTTFNKALAAKKRLHNHIKEKVRKMAPTESDTVSALGQILLSAKPELSLPEPSGIKSSAAKGVEDAIIELLFAGQETLTSALTSTVLMLGQNSPVVDKIREELRHHDLLHPDANLTYSKVVKLTYIQSVCKEILHKCPPSGGVFRKVKTTFEINNYQIPKEWTVIGAIKDSHDVSGYFKEREMFKPERWSDETGNGPAGKSQFLTFGDGARSCVGKEYAKLLHAIFIIVLVRECVWTLKNPHVKMVRLPSYRPKDGLPTLISRLRMECDDFYIMK